jgi:CRISPR/Cas system-associated exonuclease Cas4 (RecB family)
MKTFLEYVAEDILKKYGTNLSRVVVVFPNKRASLFLNDALASLTDKPLWSPRYVTISDLFRQQAAPVHVGDPIKLVCELYKVYSEVTGFDETIDHFYGWGQLLVSDFDDVDKNLAPADKVFANVRDIHELDDVSYLSEEQRQMLRKFFSNFSEDHNSQLKERFLRLWSRIGDIYHRYNQRLQELQLAYEGALYRCVAERADSMTFSCDHYLFVGFNLLQPVEQRLFSALKRQGKAHFYWDFDHSYMYSEAGHFISQYLDRFPNELDTSREDIYDNFRQKKDVRFISATTENVQARYVSQWLKDREASRHTAIVMCNEALLPAVVHSIPPTVDSVNITTGYPLQLTPIASFINLLYALFTAGYDHQRRRFRYPFLKRMEKHPYMKYWSLPQPLQSRGEPPSVSPPWEGVGEVLSSLLDAVGTVARNAAQQDANEGAPLRDESLFRAYTLLNRLKGLVDDGDLHVDDVTMGRLINQLIQQTSIPFHGEPAEGVQVMGVLETRNLDFDHLLLLSTNEGNMPRGASDSSFIPYSIRKAYGLTTVEHRVAIYAYYFYRLLSRAKDVTIIYNNATSDGQTGEMSRFMLQMLVESPHTIQQYALQAGQTVKTLKPCPIEKTPAVLDVLRGRFSTFHPSQSPLLTPTAINRYMRCPLQFYYNYVEGLREPNEVEEDRIDNRIFGNIFHTAAQLLYEQMMERSPLITAGDIDQRLKQRVDIERIVDQAFCMELFRQPDGTPAPSMPELNGLQIINREVIIHYLCLLLELDRRLTPFTILQLEADVVVPLQIPSLGITTTIGGRVDRLDSIVHEGEERIRVIDYKTGSGRLRPLPDVESIFDGSQLHNHSDYYLQTLLYARLVSRRHPSIPVAPALLFIQHTRADDYDPILCFGKEKILDIATADGNRFVELLVDKVNEIFSPDLPFSPTSDRDLCRTCPYVQFCGIER